MPACSATEYYYSESEKSEISSAYISRVFHVSEKYFSLEVVVKTESRTTNAAFCASVCCSEWSSVCASYLKPELMTMTRAFFPRIGPSTGAAFRRLLDLRVGLRLAQVAICQVETVVIRARRRAALAWCRERRASAFPQRSREINVLCQGRTGEYPLILLHVAPYVVGLGKCSQLSRSQHAKLNPCTTHVHAGTFCGAS